LKTLPRQQPKNPKPNPFGFEKEPRALTRDQGGFLLCLENFSGRFGASSHMRRQAENADGTPARSSGAAVSIETCSVHSNDIVSFEA
jgi:hypothetical protein